LHQETGLKKVTGPEGLVARLSLCQLTFAYNMDRLI